MSNIGKILVNIRIPANLYHAYKNICKEYGYSISGRMRRMIENDYDLILNHHKARGYRTVEDLSIEHKKTVIEEKLKLKNKDN